MSSEGKDALTAWVQTVVDLIRDVNRDTENQRAEFIAAIAEIRRADTEHRTEVWRRLNELTDRIEKIARQLERDEGAKEGAEEVRGTDERRSWEFRMVVLAAVLSVVGNIFAWYRTEGQALELEVLRRLVPPGIHDNPHDDVKKLR